MRDSVSRRYEALAEAGEIAPNAVQRQLAARLDRLVEDLAERRLGSKKSALGWLFSKRRAPLRGLYIWGPVGRGKTLMMDLFFAAAPNERKRRVHFHAFMDDVHGRIAEFRRRLRDGEVKGDDPIAPVAADLAAETRLLCFDEFSVGDIADAMILGRLFEQLLGRGVVVVATSNVAIDRLYEGGLNRALFLPFIALLKQHMASFHLDAPEDFRAGKGGPEPLFLTLPGREAERRLTGHFRRLTGRERGERLELRNKGRRIVVPEAADGVARFHFDDLCARPLNASDYLKIAHAFHTLIVSDIPVLGPETRNEAKRFINLIDALYDRRVRLIASAAAAPGALWQGGGGAEGFEFARTASRLTEMQSPDYAERQGAGPV